MKKLLFQSSVFMLLLVQPTYAASIQDFDTDPGWTRFNNPANSNDFGFRDSNHVAGGTAGEAGGFFSVTSVPVWYGDESVGNLGGNDALSASGLLHIQSVDMPYNNNVFIGHFDNGGFRNREINGIGFQVLESAAQIGTSEFRIFYQAGTNEGPLFTIVDSLDLTRTWSYNYDPSAGSFGSLTVSISGPGGGAATHFLSSVERGSIGSIETFGLAVGGISGAVNTAQAEIYVDNLIYGIDSDGDGVLDDFDFCPDTAIPESVPTVNMNPNHWALFDDDSEFDTVITGNGKGPNRSYLIEDTAGCSCTQIIEAQGLGNGHTRHGCSISAMDDWVELVN